MKPKKNSTESKAGGPLGLHGPPKEGGAAAGGKESGGHSDSKESSSSSSSDSGSKDKEKESESHGGKGGKKEKPEAKEYEKNIKNFPKETEGAAIFEYVDEETGISQKFAFSLRYYVGASSVKLKK